MMSFFPSRFRSETETEFGWPPTGRWIAGRKEIPAPGWGAAQLSATRRRKRRVLNTQRLIQEPDQRQHLPTGRWIAGRKEIPAPGWGAAQLSATRRRKRRVLNTQRLIQEPDQRQHL